MDVEKEGEKKTPKKKNGFKSEVLGEGNDCLRTENKQKKKSVCFIFIFLGFTQM